MKREWRKEENGSVTLQVSAALMSMSDYNREPRNQQRSCCVAVPICKRPDACYSIRSSFAHDSSVPESHSSNNSLISRNVSCLIWPLFLCPLFAISPIPLYLNSPRLTVMFCSQAVLVAVFHRTCCLPCVVTSTVLSHFLSVASVCFFFISFLYFRGSLCYFIYLFLSYASFFCLFLLFIYFSELI
jgi:hypothetical protein